MTGDNHDPSPPAACVIGWPIRHSRSPLIHRFWLDQHGIAGTYDVRAVAPADLPRFIAAMQDTGLAGCNVTVPHKEAVIELLDDIDDTARMIGAVNTIWHDGTRRIGGNTDMAGFLANLDAGAAGWDKKKGAALVLGAGGAARAVIAGLASRGFQHLIIANRSLERAKALARDFETQATAITAIAIDQAASVIGDVDLLVNATSLGMDGSGALDVDPAGLRDHAVINDLVYVPLETPLLARGRRRGLRCVDGLGMLLHQAAPGFSRWFGIMPQVTDALRAHVLTSFDSAS